MFQPCDHSLHLKWHLALVISCNNFVINLKSWKRNIDQGSCSLREATGLHLLQSIHSSTPKISTNKLMSFFKGGFSPAFCRIAYLITGENSDESQSRE